MQIALFFFVNLLAAVVFGAMSYVQGYGALAIALRVGAVLIALQLAYVIWVVVSSRFLPATRADKSDSGNSTRRPDAVGVDTVRATGDGSGGSAS